MMKAVRIYKYGGPEVLVYEDARRPDLKDDEILIRVHAAGVNPADWQIRSGKRFKSEEPFSIILGFDVSGVVESMGGNVTGFSIGDSVYGMLPIKRAGGYAEYVAAPAVGFARKPRSLKHVHAAAMPVVSLTAWQTLFDAARLSSGQTVLIHAASGGVGHIAVQLARWKGAHVIGTASGRSEKFLREIGVHEFVNYRTTRFEDVVRDVDVVLDIIPRDVDAASDALAKETLKRSWSVIKDNGVIVSICTRPSSESAAARGVRGEYVLAQPRGDQLAKIGRLVDEGHIKPVISAVLPLKDARKAHELSESGRTKGKIVLQVI
jgi:NADPH:quinone reductase-like Zn-dependent oxidoreductase